MKKTKILIVVIIALALVPTLFLLGYYDHKSTDNIPSLDIISQMNDGNGIFHVGLHGIYGRRQY